ncbi:hypothetical protein FV217_20385 [Methylobacterium sp. WL9]|nr:hypothetical protein FV217_20385 [Methylobacterium sp. WL9]
MAVVARLGRDVGTEPGRGEESLRTGFVVEGDAGDIEAGRCDVAVDLHVATAQRNGGPLVGGLAGADVEQRVAMGARDLGTFLLRPALAVRRDEHEVAILPVDPDVGRPASLRSEITLGDPGAAALFSDQSHERRGNQITPDDTHTLNLPAGFDVERFDITIPVDRRFRGGRTGLDPFAATAPPASCRRREPGT